MTKANYRWPYLLGCASKQYLHSSIALGNFDERYYCTRLLTLSSSWIDCGLDHPNSQLDPNATLCNNDTDQFQMWEMYLPATPTETRPVPTQVAWVLCLLFLLSLNSNTSNRCSSLCKTLLIYLLQFLEGDPRKHGRPVFGSVSWHSGWKTRNLVHFLFSYTICISLFSDIW